MKKVNNEMLEYWLGCENPKDLLMEIANSIFDEEEYTPRILYNDITESWKVLKEDEKNGTYNNNDRSINNKQRS